MRDFLTKPALRRQQMGWIIQDDALNFAGHVNGMRGALNDDKSQTAANGD
ncbi:hypothetical protein HX870_12775 [Pseudomonas gingeri]|nr:hypothetical protein [Pseudomonas gingeri]NWA23431.1 hypothetical protein [Pseudomonas gingeri]NWD68469.1 hypothetical protein [Pseudomonas gingeri]